MQEAQIAAMEGNYPFGTVMADSAGNVIGATHNTQNTESDPIAHAEINLIRILGKKHTVFDFNQFYLVSNAESCSMCMSAAIKAGIINYVFGAPSEAHMEPFLTVSELVRFCRQRLNITFGILAEECAQQIAKFRKEQGKLAQ